MLLQMNILITTYFRSKQLNILLKSIRPQILKGDCLTIVYQKLDFHTEEVLHGFDDLPLVKIPISERGAVNAVIAGMKKVESGGFLLLDDDVILSTNYLKRLRVLISENPRTLIAGTNIPIRKEIRFDENIDQIIENSISKNAHEIGTKRIFGHIVGRFQEPFEGPLVSIDHFQGCNVYIPLNEIYPSNLFKGDSVYYEMSWAFKLSKSIKMVVKPDLAVLHVQPPNQIRISERSTDTLKRVYTASRNMSLVMMDLSNPIERVLSSIWFRYIGQKPVYGLLRSVVAVFRDKVPLKIATSRFLISRRGWKNAIQYRKLSQSEISN